MYIYIYIYCSYGFLAGKGGGGGGGEGTSEKIFLSVNISEPNNAQILYRSSGRGGHTY